MALVVLFSGAKIGAKTKVLDFVCCACKVRWVLGEMKTCLLLCLMATSNDIFSPEEYKQVSESDCD